MSHATASAKVAAELAVEPRLSRVDRWQPLLLVGAVALGLGVAQLAPGLADGLGPVVAIGVAALIYLAMLGINLGQVASALTERRFVALAVGVNFVVNPLLAWGLGAVFLADQPDLRIGLILFLVTPCIGWYLIFTELAGGDVGLGVTLLGVNVVLQILLLPVYLYAFAGESAGVHLGGIATSILAFLVAPAVAAWATRETVDRSPLAFDDLQRVVGALHLKTAALVVVIVAMFASQADALLENPGIVGELLPPMIVFFVLAFLTAVAVGSAADLPRAQTALLVFTTTSRNSEASLAIAATAFASPLVGLTVVIGPIIELPLLVLMVHVLNQDWVRVRG